MDPSGKLRSVLVGEKVLLIEILSLKTAIRSSAVDFLVNNGDMRSFSHLFDDYLIKEHSNEHSNGHSNEHSDEQSNEHLKRLVCFASSATLSPREYKVSNASNFCIVPKVSNVSNMSNVFYQCESKMWHGGMFFSTLNEQSYETAQTHSAPNVSNLSNLSNWIIRSSHNATKKPIMKALNYCTHSHQMKIKGFHPLSFCSNRQLLIRCGDIESNPGPGPAVRNNQQGGENAEALGGSGDQEMQPSGNRVGSAKQKSDLQVVTLNIRGLSDPKKARHVINKCYKLTNSAANSLFMFQETYVTNLTVLTYLWRGDYHLTPGTGNSQGCLTLITSPYKIVHSSNIGSRAHVLVLTKNNLNAAELIVVNAYAPNGNDDEKLRFFEEVIKNVSENMVNYNCHNVVLAGDLNLVFNECEVKNRAYLNSERRVAMRVKEMFSNINLEDGWEKTSTRSFTWTSSRTGTPAFSTLDRVLFSKGVMELKSKNTDWAFSMSDHAAVIANLMFINVKTVKNPTISRLDPRLLLDREGLQHLECNLINRLSTMNGLT